MLYFTRSTIHQATASPANLYTFCVRVPSNTQKYSKELSSFRWIKKRIWAGHDCGLNTCFELCYLLTAWKPRPLLSACSSSIMILVADRRFFVFFYMIFSTLFSSPLRYTENGFTCEMKFITLEFFLALYLNLFLVTHQVIIQKWLLKCFECCMITWSDFACWISKSVRVIL